MNPDDELRVRITALESGHQALRRENRCLKQALALGTIVIAIVGVSGANQARPRDAVERERFLLRDKNGGMRALLEVSPDGAPILALYDQRGKNRLTLELSKEGTPGMNFFNDRDRLRLGIGLWPDRSAGMGIYGEDGKPRAGLSVFADGAPSLNFYDAEGADRVALDVLPGRSPRFELFGQTGRVIFRAPAANR